MRLNTLLAMLAVAVSASSSGNASAFSFGGGPADGHDLQWYTAHYPEAKAEADYCMKKYQGPNSSREDAMKSPNFCHDAIRATKIYTRWAWNAGRCKMHGGKASDISCKFATSDAKKLDTTSKEAQELAAKVYLEVKKVGDGI